MMAPNAGGGPVVAVSEADVILPPPSSLNPIPSLPAALRLDNREQLLSVLLEPSISAPDSTGRRQLLVFEDDALRHLLLRQVLNDPHSKTNNGGATGSSSKQTKKNWETFNHFQFPKALQGSIVGTRVLTKPDLESPIRRKLYTSAVSFQEPKNESSVAASTNRNPFDTDDYEEKLYGSSAMEKDVLGGSGLDQHVDVVTYFIRPWNLEHTQLLIHRIQHWNSSSSSSSAFSPRNLKKPSTPSGGSSSGPLHRIVYLPQPTALVQQLWMDTGVFAAANVSISSLQLDLFPLETDVISMECPEASKEAHLDGTPSALVTACARAILKLQDITGPIPRLQSLGPLGEEVLTKAANMAVDEYLAMEGGGAGGNGEESQTAGSPKSLVSPSSAGSISANPTFMSSTTVGTVDDHDAPTKLPPNHLAMMVFDRKIDMVTPMVTPLTYEGLLDHVVGIEGGFIQVPLQTLNPEEDEPDESNRSNSPTRQKQSKSSPVVLGVHAGDSLYAEVRDQHVEKFGSFLQNQAKALQESHANFTNQGAKKDLSEIHQFVKQIPMFTQNLRSLTNHIHLAELIKAHTEHVNFREQWQTERSIIEGDTCYDVLEEWICSGHPLDKILRALCLQSLCSGGLKGSRYDNLRGLIVQGYGYECLLMLHDLESMGWIRRKDTLWMDSASSAFPVLRKSLILINAEVDTVEPDDVAYASSGYAPVTVRLVQSAIQGWTSSKVEILKELPGRLIDIEQCWPPQDLATTLRQQSPPTGDSLGDYAKKQLSRIESGGGSSSRLKPTLIVMYCGGISYMEIAALRFLSKRPTFPYNIIMVTTKIINGSSMLRQTLG